ncbi:growth hormone receptor a [Lates japonicus]|uniref:Growth hormone receptor a n=1 Tax=Lates japonicus TaxID=270547 RepID=A0AAD3R792_LATJO|nr:growth hormone receptor a [Lates japonicus]
MRSDREPKERQKGLSQGCGVVVVFWGGVEGAEDKCPLSLISLSAYRGSGDIPLLVESGTFHNLSPGASEFYLKKDYDVMVNWEPPPLQTLGGLMRVECEIQYRERGMLQLGSSTVPSFQPAEFDHRRLFPPHPSSSSSAHQTGGQRVSNQQRGRALSPPLTPVPSPPGRGRALGRPAVRHRPEDRADEATAQAACPSADRSAWRSPFRPCRQQPFLTFRSTQSRLSHRTLSPKDEYRHRP